MTTDKSQPTGWVVVDFDAKFDQTFFGKDGWRYAHNACTIQPFDGLGDANVYRSGDEEVHPWPLPASVIARLKAKHPRQDWSQVPVADAPAEKPGRWVIQDTQPDEIGEFRDSIGWRNHASQCLNPWGSKVEASEAAVNGGWRLPRFRVVNLDDLPSPAVAEPSEVERLRAEVEKLTRERDEARASFASICRHSDEQRLELDRLRKSPLLSRRDEFAKAALTGLLADPRRGTFDYAKEAVRLADATIRAIDDAGGA